MLKKGLENEKLMKREIDFSKGERGENIRIESIAGKQLQPREELMKKEIDKQTNKKNEDMLPEYDFTKMKGGIHGKYYKAYREGHTVKIHKMDEKSLWLKIS